jgi:hypothetical protein
MNRRRARRAGSPCGAGEVGVFFDNQYQLAYVAADLDEGAAVLEAEFGAPKFKPLGGRDIIENRVWTPAGDRDIVMKASISQVGGLTLELLQPISGAVDIFTEMLVPGQAIRLHHIGMRTQDIDRMRTENEKLGRQVVMAGGFDTARFIYVDARATLGHFLEYAAAPPEHWNR